jgi:hypothetical protein
MLEALASRLDQWLAGAPGLVSPIYPWLSAGHILALGLLIGSITVLDLRLLCLFRSLPLPPLAVVLSRMAAFGLGLAMLTGLALFSVQPSHYLDNPAFLLKLGLLVAGLINVALVHALRGWRGVLAGQDVDLALRVMAVISLALWVGVVLAGRWVAFV